MPQLADLQIEGYTRAKMDERLASLAANRINASPIATEEAKDSAARRVDEAEAKAKQFWGKIEDLHIRYGYFGKQLKDTLEDIKQEAEKSVTRRIAQLSPEELAGYGIYAVEDVAPGHIPTPSAPPPKQLMGRRPDTPDR